MPAIPAIPEGVPIVLPAGACAHGPNAVVAHECCRPRPVFYTLHGLTARLKHKVVCVVCGISGQVTLRKNVREFAYYRRMRSDRWAFHGESDLNAPATYPLLLIGGSEVPNPGYDPDKRPHIVELWLCPRCENETRAKMFEALVAKARQMFKGSGDETRQNRPD